MAQRLSDLAKTQHAWRERFRQEWVRAQKQRLKANDVETVERSIEAIGMHVTNHEESEAEYWARNRERMRYGAFKDRGWPRGSGAVESAVRRVVNLRMKGASITWLEEHAEGMLMLRAHAKSGRWDELERTVLAKTGWTPTYRLVRQPA